MVSGKQDTVLGKRYVLRHGADASSNEIKLKFYAYYKAATKGKDIGAEPGMFSFEGRAKWGAWKKFLDEHGSLDEDELKGLGEKMYVELFKDLFQEAGAEKK